MGACRNAGVRGEINQSGEPPSMMCAKSTRSGGLQHPMAVVAWG